MTQFGGAPEPGSSPYNRGTVFIADDGSMAKFTSSAAISDSTSCEYGETIYPSGTLLLRDGTKYTITSGHVTQIEDRNGNITTIGSTITDSLGRTYTISSSNGTDQIQ